MGERVELGDDSASRLGGAEAAPDDALAAPAAAHPTDRFLTPWVRRVRDVDDHLLSELLRTLVGMRRLKLAVGAAAAAAGGLLFGLLPINNPTYALLIYGTLAATVALPVIAISSLSVRNLFLREGTRNGLSRNAAMLVLTRAQRRARFLPPWNGTDEQVALLRRAVRDPDIA
jgi:hypothetical protein